MRLLLPTNLLPRMTFRCALLLSLSLGLASCRTFEAGLPAKLTTPEKMAWSTYPIATRKGLGTCIIVKRKDPDAPDGVASVLVTCAHVLAAMPRGPYFLVVRTPTPGANPSVMILSIDIAPDCKHPYIKHPLHDIAAMQIDIPPEIAHVVTVRSFISESALARQRSPHVGDPIFVLGFPKVFPGTEGAFPVFRSGTIASYSSGSQTDKEKYLVYTNIYSGDSGGPVFAARSSGAPQLLGLVSERIGQKAGDVPLAVAVDVNVIRETLALFPQRRFAADLNSDSGQLVVGSKALPSVKLIGSPELLEEILDPKLRLRRAIETHRENP